MRSTAGWPILIEPWGAARTVASFDSDFIGRPVPLRMLPRGLFAPVSTGELVLHAAVAVANPDVEVLAVQHLGVAFGQWT